MRQGQGGGGGGGSVRGSVRLGGGEGVGRDALELGGALAGALAERKGAPVAKRPQPRVA